MNNVFLLNWISDSLKEMGLLIPGMIRTWFYDISSFIYGMISYFYQVFEVLCSGKILNSDELGALFGRISVLLGIVMMFRITITFIQALIDPDSGLGDKEKGIQNIIVKVVVVIIMFGLSNYVFDLAADIQGAIIEKNVIAGFLLPGEVDTKKFGGTLAADLFTSFYDVDPDVDPSKFKNADDSSIYDCVQEDRYINGLRLHIRDANDFDFMKNQCLLARGEYAGTDDGVYVIKFNYVFSPVVGIIVLWFLINYCLSVGIRIIQLAFLQIISPIAFIGYLEPKSDNMFTRWLKTYISTYVDVFIRMAIISFVCYICAKIMEGWNKVGSENVFWNSVGNPKGMVAKVIGVLVILALFEFAKKAPELIKNIFPVGSSGLSFGTNKEAFSPFRSAATFGLGAAAGIGLTAAMGAKSAFAKRNAQRRDLENLGLERPSGRLFSPRQWFHDRDYTSKYMRGVKDRWRNFRGTADEAARERVKNLDLARLEYGREVSSKTRNAALYGFASGALTGVTHGFKGVTHGFKGEKIGEKVKGAWKAQNESDDKFESFIHSGGHISQLLDSKFKSLFGETEGQKFSRIINNSETAASYRDQAYELAASINSIRTEEAELHGGMKDGETEEHYNLRLTRTSKNVSTRKDEFVKAASEGKIGYSFEKNDVYEGFTDSSEVARVRRIVERENPGADEATLKTKFIEKCRLNFENKLISRSLKVINDLTVAGYSDEKIEEVTDKFNDSTNGYIAKALRAFDRAVANGENEFFYDIQDSEILSGEGDITRANTVQTYGANFVSHIRATSAGYIDKDGNVGTFDGKIREAEARGEGIGQIFIDSRKLANNTRAFIERDPEFRGALAADKKNGIDSNATSVTNK